jgi:CheY-like chemotaxis protein
VPPTRDRVLLVDDSAAFLTRVANDLAPFHSVYTARSGEEALALLQEHAADTVAVISDYLMPGGMDGVALLDTVKERFPSVRRILYSISNSPPGAAQHQFVSKLPFESLTARLSAAIPPPRKLNNALA